MTGLGLIVIRGVVVWLGNVFDPSAALRMTGLGFIVILGVVVGLGNVFDPSVALRMTESGFIVILGVVVVRQCVRSFGCAQDDGAGLYRHT
jgi:uncharacterized membrane protein